MSILVVRFVAPMMSCGGSDAVFTTRTTGRHITKSQCLGTIHNARGGLDTEAIPDLLSLGVSIREDVPPQAILDDYQTVAGVMHADRKIRKGRIASEQQQVHKHYLCDAAMTAFIVGGRDLLGEIAEYLADPVRPLYIGRRNCVPSEPLVEDPTTAVIDTDDVKGAMREVPLIAFSDRPLSTPVRCHVEIIPGMQMPDPIPLISRIRDVPMGVLRDRIFGYRQVYTRRIPRNEFPEETE